MLGRILQAVGLGGAQNELGSVKAATAVRIRGRVVSANSVESPVSGRRGAAISYSIGRRRMVRQGPPNNQKNVEITEVLRVAVVSGDLVIACDDGNVLVPQGAFEIEFGGGSGLDVLPSFTGQLPAALADMQARCEVGELLYGEKMLQTEDAVELVAVVEPSTRDDLLADRGGYRDAPRTRAWQVSAGSETKAVLHDRTLEAMGIDIGALSNDRLRKRLTIGGLLLIPALLTIPFLARFC